MNPKKTSMAALSLALAFGAAACGDSESADSTTTTVAKTTTTAAMKSSLVIENQWVKATEETKSAAFGDLENKSDKEITVTGGTSEVAGTIELHETVMGAGGSMEMRKKEGGFVIPAMGKFPLAPGANHIMLLDLKKAIKAGDKVSITLNLSDGTTMAFDATAKEFSGANESYEGASGATGMHGGGMGSSTTAMESSMGSSTTAAGM